MDIIPPILVDENGDVQAYSSAASAAAAVEPIDVLNGEYAFYDSTGRVLEALVAKGKVHFNPTLKSSSESQVLRKRLERVLLSLGISVESLANLSLAKLSELLLERSNRSK